MSDEAADQIVSGNCAELSGEETLVDILSGATVRATPKTRLVQKVLRQLIETYGFDRKDIRTRYRLTTAGRRQTVDIVIFRRGREALDEHVERVIVCKRRATPATTRCKIPWSCGPGRPDRGPEGDARIAASLSAQPHLTY